ncbi:MAG: OmpA family protein [Alphaproteobacteria bacterium]|nr:MAG: OmpA family protein [Alphaproteobacteria bacterium]
MIGCRRGRLGLMALNAFSVLLAPVIWGSAYITPASLTSPPPPAPVIVDCFAGPFIVFFDPGSDEITDRATAILDTVAALWESGCVDGATADISGHTDNSAAEERDPLLSYRRAERVRRYLLGRNVPGAKITTKGLGISEPLVNAPRGAPDAQNRYVIITFLPEAGW